MAPFSACFTTDPPGSGEHGQFCIVPFLLQYIGTVTRTDWMNVDLCVTRPYPEGKEHFKDKSWCPPSQFCYDQMEPIHQIGEHHGDKNDEL